jgi:hypothetical protein
VDNTAYLCSLEDPVYKTANHCSSNKDFSVHKDFAFNQPNRAVSLVTLKLPR